MANLYERYLNEVRPGLQQELELDNVMMVPRLEKVTLNMGVGEAIGEGLGGALNNLFGN